MTTLTRTNTENKLDSLIFLRGVAVIMVCASHFGPPLSDDPAFSALFKWLGRYGQYGVHIFFVISGFIIPYSFLNRHYCITDFGRFCFKRFLRLHPPYIAALLLTLLISYFSYKSRHAVFPENFFSVLKSMVYLHIPKNNIVFWTLIVEIQFYFFIGLFYPVLINYYKLALFVVVPVLLMFSVLRQPTFVSLFNYITFFLIGTISFLVYTKKGNLVINFISLIILTAFAAWRYEMPALISSLITIMVIGFVKFSIPKFILFPGIISYSVYLVHYPVGLITISFFKSVIDPSYYWGIFLVSLVVVMIVASIFYKLFEEYAEYFSRKIKYKGSLNTG